MKLLLTFDVEPDYTTGEADPYRHLHAFFNYVILKLVKMSIPAVLFITGEVAKRFIEEVEKYADFFEIGVHTHPNYHPEFNKTNKLSRYPYEKQYQMIKRDFDMVEEITGRRPRVFRAGKFAANEDTLKVLSKLGIKADSSLTVPYIFSFRALRERPWLAFREQGLLRIPVLAVDKRVIGWSFEIKNLWLDVVGGRNTHSCVCLHSWFAARNGLSIINDYRVISFDEFCEGIC